MSTSTSRQITVDEGASHPWIATQSLETPVGSLVAGALSQGICLLDYSDRYTPEQIGAMLHRRFGQPVLATTSPLLERLRDELSRYFASMLTVFTVPLLPSGTLFQQRVWAELQCIPYGETISYSELAHRIGQPKAVRAVAQANGLNPISILIPCHRVIGKDGQLTGYSGGLWRKRLLLELECTAPAPTQANRISGGE
jgi:AraC family transcriptional regulator of adaptative response/methylated-DNA-[protein]-cysteine methyltransferase